MILAVDFDSTIAVRSESGELEIKRDPVTGIGADDGLRGAFAAGHELILHSVRSACPVGWEASRGRFYSAPTEPIPSAEDTIQCFDEMRAFLRHHRLWTVDEGGVFARVWELPGKPYADAYLDDKAFNMRSQDAWSRAGKVYGLG